MFKCLICNKKLASRGSFYHHKKLHDKTFQCKICLKPCASKALLTIHNRSHTGEKPYACSICDKRFARKDQLKKHQVAHSDERKFKCKICPDKRSFKTKGDLTKHMKFHYEPTYSCTKCGKKFHTSFQLKRHEKTHLS